MPPVLIDLTSSPEPEDSPETAARSALQTYRPRKRRETDSKRGRLVRERENEVSPSQAAKAALEGFKPGKERGSMKDNARASSRQISQSDACAELVEAREQKRRMIEENIQEGSLASLLQQEAQKSSRASISNDAISRNGGSNPTSHRRRPENSPNMDTEIERVRLLGTFQRGQPTETGWQPQPAMVHPKKANPRQRTPMNAAVLPSTQVPVVIVDLDADERPAEFSNIVHPKPREVLSHGGDDSPRPLKRRRMSEGKKSQGSAPKSLIPSQSVKANIPIRSASPISIASTTSPQVTSKQQQSPEVPNASKLTDESSGESQDRQLNGIGSSKLSAGPNGTQSSSNNPVVSLEVHGEPSQNRNGLLKEPTFPGSPRSHPDIPGKRAPVQISRQHLYQSNDQGNHSPNASKAVNVDAVDSAAVLSDDIKEVAENVSSQSYGAKTSLRGPYTSDEDALLIQLKEVERLSWDEIATRFHGQRTRGSLQVRYSTKLHARLREPVSSRDKTRGDEPVITPFQATITRSASPDAEAQARCPRKKRNNGVSAPDGFISWKDLKKKQLPEDFEHEVETENPPAEQPSDASTFRKERAYPKSLLRILRQREFGSNAGRSWRPTTKSVPDEVKEHVFDIGPRKYYKGTSGDVTCLAWAPNGETFAAGSIAITDERSMQYNRPCNLLLGRHEQDSVQELPEHHIIRPNIKADSGNVNGLHSMRETQDPRLFMTVASVQFSPDSKTLYSAGTDQKVRAYEVDHDRVSCMYAIDHAAPIYLLSVSNSGVLATACHQSLDNSIGVYRGTDQLLSLSPRRADELTKRAIYPSALKWGAAHHHSNLLLAGFSIDSTDEERNIAGETCLWDASSETRIEISGVTRNVFDVAWNPSPTSTSSIFAVASSRGTGRTSRGTRSVVQCFAPGQNRAKRVVEWECSAFDINDVAYCQHDDNLIAAGATDGKVYIWDQRFADRSGGPLHILQHGDTLNVLDHDRDREIADTGVRFVAWGATSSRLYTGSSDGVVKVWNPYRATEYAHIKDVATFNSAVMSGAFSSDYRDLLIGEDQGRINSLSVGCEHSTVRSMRQFEVRYAPTPTTPEDPFSAARELRKSGEISIRPMGDLPKLQAVQGPHYRGRYLKPSPSEVDTTQKKYHLALDEQNEAELRIARSGSPSPDDDFELRDANKKVQEAQYEMMRTQSRLDDSAVLGPQAKAKQLAFLRAEEARLKLEESYPAENCRLSCNYLPSSVDDDGEVPDSGRSEMRIPGALRPLRAANTSISIIEDILEDQMIAECLSCFGATRKPRPGQQPLCKRCQQIKIGLTAFCELCLCPMRPSSSASNPDLCERCNFACFRCANPIVIARDVSLITCDHCGLTWKAGVLGYELVNRVSTRKSSLKQISNEVLDDAEGFGYSEMQHYASRWQT